MQSPIEFINNIAREFTLAPQELDLIVNHFAKEMHDGLSGQTSSLKMLPSFLTRPAGNETGRYLAIDFGGTNLRVLDIELLGCGHFIIHKQRAVPLSAPDGSYNFIAKSVTIEQLFDFIAAQIASVAEHNIDYPLGHTFSFPTQQVGVNQASLIHWTKEIMTAGGEGRDINSLLSDALQRHGLSRIRPCAIINDTVGTLLSAAYVNPQTDIGSICGTGHNTAYLEPCHPLINSPMIVNIESGNFDKLPFTRYDEMLTNASDKPGEQRLEKMVSGRYMGELVRLILLDLFQGSLDTTAALTLQTPWSIPSVVLSAWLADETPTLTTIGTWLEGIGLRNANPDCRTALKTAAHVVFLRSARLAAATYLGILQHIDYDLLQHHHIAIDGSLYEKVPGYAQAIHVTLDGILGTKKSRVTISLAKDNSSVGAAVAVAVAIANKQSAY